MNAMFFTKAVTNLALSLIAITVVKGDGDKASTYLRGMQDNTLENHKSMDIVGFWHIGGNYQASGESRDSFVTRQGKEILESYLFNEGMKTGDYNLRLNYVSTVDLSDETKTFLGQTGTIHEHPPTLLMREEGVEYFEYPTLVELHAFCQEPENIDKIVFYMHSKTNDNFRIPFENYLLGDSCLQCMKNEEKQACGPWYTGTNNFFWKHFSGNFWMTRCSHVAQLNTPFYPELLNEGHNPNFHPPTGRIFAEYWMMNDAGPRPERTNDLHEIRHGLLKTHQVCSDRYRIIGPED